MSTFNRAVSTADQGVSAFGEAVATTVGSDGLKRHQLAINDHRQALNPCKQAINALASSPDAFAISITNRAILINTPANPLNNRAAVPDDHASGLDE